MINNIEALLSKVTKEIREKTDIAIVGLSGGADSTLVSILCTLALGRDNVYGVHMPYNQLDKNTFNARSKSLATKLSINEETVNIQETVDALSNQFYVLSTLNRGNMRSRMRMVSLYTVACNIAEEVGRRVRVVGTGNLSEDYIGYDTKGGDALTDFFPIGTLFKSEVYQLLEYFVANGVIDESHVDRVPSAGLWDGQTDESELGYTYNEMEPAILRCLNGTKDLNNSLDKFVWERHLNNKHKHEAPLVIDLSEFRK
jgi:NAD+ synthase